MKQNHEIELEDATKRLEASGRNPDDFDFKVAFMEPDPDGGGMFTVTYDVGVTCKTTGKEEHFIGGIGYGWVDRFEAALKDGAFD